MDMGSLRAELQLPHHFITGDEGDDLDDDIMILGSTPQVSLTANKFPGSQRHHLLISLAPPLADSMQGSCSTWSCTFAY